VSSFGAHASSASSTAYPVWLGVAWGSFDTILVTWVMSVMGDFDRQGWISFAQLSRRGLHVEFVEGIITNCEIIEPVGGIHGVSRHL